MQVNLTNEKYSPDVDYKLFNICGENIEKIEYLLPEDRTIAHIAARFGKFNSVSEAKRNGYDKPLPVGWSVHKIGKGMNSLELYIWNPEYSMEEWIKKFGE